MRVLQIGADRSKRGILFRGTPAFMRQEAYAKVFGNLDVIGFSLKNDGAEPIAADDLRVYPTNSSNKLAMLFDALRIARTLPKPDVVSVQDPFETGLVAWRIARHFGVPLHVQVHTDFLSPEYARLSLLNRLRVRLAGFVLRRASGIRVVSNRIRESLEARYRLQTPIAVLPIFVDIPKFRDAGPIPPAQGDPRFKFKTKVLLVARNAPEKNIDLAVDAFKKVAPQDACLLLSSDIHRVPFGDIRIIGMGQEALEHWYKTADLVLVPSKYEGYGLVIVEALAAGKPVLSTDVGIAREAGAIVTDEAHFAEALANWFKVGPREGRLNDYPYKNFDEYARAYCDDVNRCAGGR